MPSISSVSSQPESALSGFISLSSVSDILLEEFPDPFHLSAKELAKVIHVPLSQIEDLLDGRRVLHRSCPFVSDAFSLFRTTVF